MAATIQAVWFGLNHQNDTTKLFLFRILRGISYAGVYWYSDWSLSTLLLTHVLNNLLAAMLTPENSLVGVSSRKEASNVAAKCNLCHRELLPISKVYVCTTCPNPYLYLLCVPCFKIQGTHKRNHHMILDELPNFSERKISKEASSALTLSKAFTTFSKRTCISVTKEHIGPSRNQIDFVHYSYEEACFDCF